MNYLLYLFITLTIFGLDQYTKKLVSILISEGSEVPIIKGFFNLVNVKNYGAGFSILQNQRVILILIPAIIIILIIIYLFRHKDLSKFEITSLLFILSGACGNLFDRAFRGYVIDFFDFIFFGYHYPSFNVADTFITVGAIMLIVYIIYKERKHGKKEINSSN